MPDQVPQPARSGHNDRRAAAQQPLLLHWRNATDKRSNADADLLAQRLQMLADLRIVSGNSSS
jgi:hypothetical protein